MMKSKGTRMWTEGDSILEDYLLGTTSNTGTRIFRLKKESHIAVVPV